MKKLAYIVLFDGDSNAQKAGKTTKTVYPRVTYLHGVGHCVDIFF